MMGEGFRTGLGFGWYDGGGGDVGLQGVGQSIG